MLPLLAISGTNICMVSLCKWVENLLADHQDNKTNQVTDIGICEEEADGNSEVGAQLEVETDTRSEEAETSQPKQGAN